MIEEAISAMNIPFATPIALFFQYHAYETVLLLAIVTLPFFSRKGKHYAVVSALVLAVAAVYLLKLAYGMERPCGMFSSKVECPLDYSFPSGHVAVSFVFVAATLGTALFPVYFPIALLIAFSRLYLGVHTVSDVMGGIVVGLACYLVAEEIVDSMLRMRKAGGKKGRGKRGR